MADPDKSGIEKTQRLSPCPSCGADNPSDASTCKECGASFSPSPLDDMATLTPEEISKGSGGEVPLKSVRLRQDRLGDRYELKALLGKGGMGVVYRARDLQLNEDIAIKLLRSEYSESDEDINRFKREIKTARRINSDHVIRIHDIGIADDELFISMELLTGGTLADLLKKEGRPSIDDCLTIAIGICDGLAAAHRKGVIHRDLKPHNVLFDEHGVVKLVDFGIARLSATTSHTVGVTGTPHYMSPETADGTGVTTRSDVYSMGVLLFELFTGELPFRADSLVRLALLHTQEPPPKPRSVREEIPEEVEQVILKALEKKPENRFADAIELANELRSLRGISPIPVGMTLRRRPSGAPRRRIWPLVSLVVVVACVVAAFIAKVPQRLFATATPSPTPQMATPSPTPSAIAVGTPLLPRTLSVNLTDAKTGARIRQGRVRTNGEVLCRLPCGTVVIQDDVEIIEILAKGYEPAEVDLRDLTPTDNKYEIVRTLSAQRRPQTPVVAKTTKPATPPPTREPTPAVVGYGKLTVNARPWAAVYVDDKFIGETPVRSYKIKAGTHKLRFEQWTDETVTAENKEIKYETSRTIKIRSDETVSLFADMPSQKVRRE